MWFVLFSVVILIPSTSESVEHPLLSSCFVGQTPACGVDTVLSSCSNYWRQVKQKLWTAELRVHCSPNNMYPETLGPCAPKKLFCLLRQIPHMFRFCCSGSLTSVFVFFSFPVSKKMKDQYLLSVLGRTTHSFSHSFFLFSRFCWKTCY